MHISNVFRAYKSGPYIWPYVYRNQKNWKMDAMTDDSSVMTVHVNHVITINYYHRNTNKILLFIFEFFRQLKIHFDKIKYLIVE